MVDPRSAVGVRLESAVGPVAPAVPAGAGPASICRYCRRSFSTFFRDDRPRYPHSPVRLPARRASVQPRNCSQLPAPPGPEKRGDPPRCSRLAGAFQHSVGLPSTGLPSPGSPKALRQVQADEGDGDGDPDDENALDEAGEGESCGGAAPGGAPPHGPRRSRGWWWARWVTRWWRRWRRRQTQGFLRSRFGGRALRRRCAHGPGKG